MPEIINVSGGNIEALICLCGNAVFYIADINGKEIAPTGEFYLCCTHCKRLIDATTMQVAETKPKQSISIKRLGQQTNIEKAKFLHQLLPDEIAVLLVFIEEKIKVVKNKPERLMEQLACDVAPEKWLEILELLEDIIDEDYQLLCADSDFFSTQLFDGYIGVFVIHCMQHYMNVCNNPPFFKAAELFFDL